MHHNKILPFFCLFSIIYCTYPIAFFHGITDNCENNERFIKNLQADLNVHVECIEIGEGNWDSSIKSIIQPIQTQVEEACKKINSNPYFQGKFNILGFSQGALIGRYIIEKCNMKGKVMRYISFDGPQMGVGYIPKLTCGPLCDLICNITSPWLYELQHKLGPCSYYRYKFDQETYRKENVFLKMLNNENPIKDKEIYNRFSSLEKVKLIKSKKDIVIIPKESCWFQFYDQEGKDIVPLELSDFYINDYIGLRKLNEEGKVFFSEFSGGHVDLGSAEHADFVEFFKN